MIFDNFFIIFNNTRLYQKIWRIVFQVAGFKSTNLWKDPFVKVRHWPMETLVVLNQNWRIRRKGRKIVVIKILCFLHSLKLNERWWVLFVGLNFDSKRTNGFNKNILPVICLSWFWWNRFYGNWVLFDKVFILGGFWDSCRYIFQ